MMKHPQPAQPSYFFHGGFVDIKHVILAAVKDCKEVMLKSLDGVKESWGKIRDKFRTHGWKAIYKAIPSIFMFSFYFFRLASVVIFTTAMCFFITVFQVVILAIFFIIALIFIGFITLIDKIFCILKSIVSHCPNCQKKFSMPGYICPKCGAEHDLLRPGYYGIFKRKCKCGEVLPTTFLNGRQKLEAKCPHCKHGIKDGGLHASWCIPVIGGASSGKTCYINMAMMSLEQNAQSKYKLHFEHEKNGLDEYEENAKYLRSGNLPAKTQDLQLKYYQFTLTPPGATKQQVSLCDVAGELFDVAVGGKQINQTGFQYVNAFMLIIDPLSIPEYRSEVSKTVNLSEYKGGVQPIDEMLDRFINTLQNMFSVDAKAILKTDVAVVFSKADIPGLDEKIGEGAVFKKAPKPTEKSKNETRNKLCEQFLRDYNEENFLNSLKSRFKSVQFFACSALGHIRNGQPFVASNVEEPFFWLLRKKSKVIDKAIK